MTGEPEATLAVGERVVVGGSRATVRFIGNVEDHSGEWVGVEWDDPARGKHDGEVQGRRYFQTMHKTGGSLVRRAMVEAGTDFASEVRVRYADEENMEIQSVSTKVVQVIGIDKTTRVQKQLLKLRYIVLLHGKVCRASPDCQPVFTHCVELNVFGNLLSRWIDVMRILQQVPNCRELIMGGNPMELVESADQLAYLPRAPTVRTLMLNQCHLDQRTISQVLTLFPSLRELYAAKNDMTCFSPNDGSSLSHLTLVDLEFNPIQSFRQITALSRLPNLEKLSLASCSLTRVELNNEEEQGNASSSPRPYHGFPLLHTLNLKGNHISDWDSIVELGKLPSLATLYIDYERFHAEFGLDPREVMIAKLSRLQNLERCELSVIERRSAEIRFLNKYSALPTERKVEGGHVEDLARLEKIHGAPVLENAKSKQLGVVKVAFATEEKTLPVRSVPTTLAVQKVVEMGRRLLGLPRQAELTAFLQQGEHSAELDNPMRPLSFYSPSDNDVIKICL